MIDGREPPEEQSRLGVAAIASEGQAAGRVRISSAWKTLPSMVPTKSALKPATSEGGVFMMYKSDERSEGQEMARC